MKLEPITRVTKRADGGLTLHMGGDLRPQHRCALCGCWGFPTMVDQPEGVPVLRLRDHGGRMKLVCAACEEPQRDQPTT